METTERRPDVINALKRLERAGDEHSRTTEKLKEAAHTLGCYVVEHIPVTVWADTDAALPRGYGVYNHGGTSALRHPELGPVGSSREAALTFAADVADGWLDEVVAWLEVNVAEDQAATEALERAER